MNPVFRRLVLPVFAALAVAVATIPAAPAEEEPPPDLVGTWNGELQVGTVSLRLVFHVVETEGEGLAATIDSPDQGAEGIPVERVVVDGDTARLEVTAIGAEFEGRLEEDAATWSGEWRQSGQALPLAMRRDSE